MRPVEDLPMTPSPVPRVDSVSCELQTELHALVTRDAATGIAEWKDETQHSIKDIITTQVIEAVDREIKRCMIQLKDGQLKEWHIVEGDITEAAIQRLQRDETKYRQDVMGEIRKVAEECSKRQAEQKQAVDKQYSASEQRVQVVEDSNSILRQDITRQSKGLDDLRTLVAQCMARLMEHMSGIEQKLHTKIQVTEERLYSEIQEIQKALTVQNEYLAGAQLDLNDLRSRIEDIVSPRGTTFVETSSERTTYASGIYPDLMSLLDSPVPEEEIETNSLPLQAKSTQDTERASYPFDDEGVNHYDIDKAANIKPIDLESGEETALDAPIPPAGADDLLLLRPPMPTDSQSVPPRDTLGQRVTADHKGTKGTKKPRKSKLKKGLEGTLVGDRLH